MASRRKMTTDEVPDLPGYLTVTRVAEMYGLQRSGLFYMIFEARDFKHVFKIRAGEHDKRPVFVLLEDEVRKVFAARGREPVADPEHSAKAREWNKRVKQWGRDTGWTETLISVTGRPHIELQEAYLQVHPDDPRPGSE